MSYGVYGSIGAMIFIAGAGAVTAVDRGKNYAPAKASVYMIDRTCNFVEMTTSEGRTTARGVTDACSSTEEWATVREKRNKVVAGKAVVHLTYTAPQDGSPRTAKLEFNGRDDEFYELKAGDEIEVLVSKADPGKIIAS